MRLEPIERLDDPRIAAYRNVKDATLRDTADLFVVESRLCVRRLIASSRYVICSILVTETALAALEEALKDLDSDVPVFVTDSNLLENLVGYNLHRGCIALAQRGEAVTLEAVLNSASRLIVGLEQVANPENVGNVFRNAMAFDANAVLLSRDCADPLYRKAVRVSMGGTLLTPFAYVDSWPESIARLRAAGWWTVGLSTDAGSADLSLLGSGVGHRGPIALILGAESEGLDPATLASVEQKVRIPMASGVDSLNVATAAGIALHRCFQLTRDPQP